VLAERAELVRIFGEMTFMELQLIRAATPLVSLRRLPNGGQFA
jgi:hypothetical protein